MTLEQNLREFSPRYSARKVPLLSRAAIRSTELHHRWAVLRRHSQFLIEPKRWLR